MPAPDLPTPPTPLMGRSDELAELAVLLQDRHVRLVTLMGPPGVGKTRLALRLAADHASHYPDGVRFVPLSSVEEADLVLPAVASALELVAARGDPGSVLEAYLHDRRMLLVLDNFEQVLPVAADLAALLEASPGLTLLVTSRIALGLSAEYAYRVPPLALPPMEDPPSARDLAESPSVALFVERCRAVRRDFELTDADAPAVAEICRRLDGLPLAIELAAVRAKLLGPKALLSRLADEFAVLDRGAPDRPARQRTLRATLEWSYGLLGPGGRRLFRALGVFSGGCTLEAATAVCAPGGVSGDVLLDALETLVDHSLLQVEIGQNGEPRFSMLYTVREFALERLRMEEGDGELRTRHARYFTGVAEALGPGGTGDPPVAWPDLLDRERDNFRSALAWAVDAGDADVGLALAAALWRFWEARGHLKHGRKWLSAVLALPGGANLARAGALCGAGVLARYQGEVRESRARLTEAEALWREAGRTREWAETLTYLGMAEHYLADFESARVHLGEALAYWREAEDPEGLARTLSVRAGMANHEGDHDTAEAMRLESLDLWKALEDKEGIGQALLGLGEVARCRGDLDTARDRCREALAVFREIGDPYHRGATLHNLGYIERRRGALDDAFRSFIESLGVWERTGHRLGVASCAVGLAGVRSDLGEPREAALLLGAAQRRQRELGISLVRADRGEWDEIRDGIRQALGDAVFEKTVGAGAALSLDDALQDARAAMEGRGHASGEQDALTERELEVLLLLAEGLTYAEIGRRLFISPRTVDAHLRSAYSKLGVHSRHDAVREARRAGLIPPSPPVP